jgi:diguanylate cyclase (GGDEF)-like protein
MPSATAEVAAMVAERIKAAVKSHDFNVKTGRSISLTISVGVACHPADGDSADQLLNAASSNMRQRKLSQSFPSDSATPATVLRIDAFR